MNELAAPCRHRFWWTGMVGLALLVLAQPSNAQSAYKCTRNGAVHYSDRPCDAESAAEPERSPPREAYLAFMTPGCRKMAEALDQPASTRHPHNLRYSQNWRYNEADYREREKERQRYRETCADEEQQARYQAAEAARTERSRQRAEMQQQTLTASQCGEMRRILEGRRARVSSMNAGERADLERFQANFTTRCHGVTPP